MFLLIICRCQFKYLKYKKKQEHLVTLKIGKKVRVADVSICRKNATSLQKVAIANYNRSQLQSQLPIFPIFPVFAPQSQIFRHLKYCVSTQKMADFFLHSESATHVNGLKEGQKIGGGKIIIFSIISSLTATKSRKARVPAASMRSSPTSPAPSSATSRSRGSAASNSSTLSS